MNNGGNVQKINQSKQKPLPKELHKGINTRKAFPGNQPIDIYRPQKYRQEVYLQDRSTSQVHGKVSGYGDKGKAYYQTATDIAHCCEDFPVQLCIVRLLD